MRSSRVGILFGCAFLAGVGCSFIAGVDRSSIDQEGQSASASAEGGGSGGSDAAAEGSGAASVGVGGAPMASSSSTGGSGLAECVPGFRECAGRVPRACSANGRWAPEPACAGESYLCEAGECVRPPSCRGDADGTASSCGWQADGDCCATLPLAGGTFNRSNNPEHPATVSPFHLDVYEVTVGRFREFVNAGMGTTSTAPPAGAGAHRLIQGSGWRSEWDIYLGAGTTELKNSLICGEHATWTHWPGASERLPMTCVSWFEALAFCIWDGGRLPTEAEWNHAATGGSEQRMYPWGSAINQTHAAYECTADGSAPNDCTDRDILEVGIRPAGSGRWGHLDLAGNVWEWTLDLSAPYDDPCIDCSRVDHGADRIARGGSYMVHESLLRSYIRYAVISTDRFDELGLRCARDL